MFSTITNGVIVALALCAPQAHAGRISTTRKRDVAACASTGFQNGGFESGLSSWNFTSIYGDQYGTSTCQASPPGAPNSANSALMIVRGNASDPTIEGKLAQNFTGCKNGNYAFSWSMLQVQGKTTYSKYNPEVFVSIYGPNGLTYDVASYEMRRTNFSYTGPSTAKTFKPGVWTAQTGTMQLPVGGSWKLYFEAFAPMDTQAKVDAQLYLRIDNVVVKRTS